MTTAIKKSATYGDNGKLHEQHHITHHSRIVRLQELDDVFRLLVPDEHVTAVAAADDKLAVRTVETHTLHCKIHTHAHTVNTTSTHLPLHGRLNTKEGYISRWWQK